MSNIFHRWKDIKRIRNGEMVAPHFAGIYVSEVCNQHCKGCNYANSMSGNMTSREDMFKTVDILAAAGVKAFSFCGGGEPLTNPHLPELLESIGERGLHFCLLTNGTLLNEESISIIVKYGTFIRVSLEASNKDDYTAYKGASADHWDSVLRNVSRLLQAKKLIGNQCNVGIKFSTCKSIRGEKHYRDALELGTKLGVDRITFRGLRHEPEELPVEEMEKEDKILHGVMRDVKPKIKVSRWLIPRNIERVPQCWLNPLHTVVNWNGDLYVCCFYYYRNDSHWIGNILKEPFSKIWYCGRHQWLIDHIDRKECQKVDCKFFGYHDEIEEEEKVGSLYFL